MARKVTLVELTIYERIYPLTSGYLQAYACKDTDTRKAFTFEKYATTVKTPVSTILQDLQKSDSDVYAFSCYLWNMGLVKSVIKPLLESKPESKFMLGGPQVMRHAQTYLTPQYENVLLCNGEGERPFAEFLKEVDDGKADFSRVSGVSFYRDGEVVTTTKLDRQRDLNEIPSPFLTGVFDQSYTMATFETNRGCPFSCGFCYWGAATNAKVFTFDEDRIREELTWLSKHNCVFIYIADANWGIYARDIGLSEHIAELAARYRMPSVVYYSAAKNKPERMTQITEIFTKAGVITSQPVSLQTMNETSLETIERKNIKLSSYVELQERLNEKKISSFTELIWPLPGETLASLKQGIDRLCEARADTVITYPQLLLHNTSLYNKREQLGLVTRIIDEVIGEVELVVETRDVTYHEFQEGMRFFYALHLLHNLRSLSSVSAYLNENYKIQYSELFTRFAEFLKLHPNSPIAQFCEYSLLEYDYYDLFNYGKLVHLALHGERQAFNDLLIQFIASQEWWSDSIVQGLFEIDLVNKPYVYSNTSLEEKQYNFRHLKINDVISRSYFVKVPDNLLSQLRRSVLMNDDNKPPDSVFEVNHKRLQYPYMKSQSLDHNAGYCHGMIIRVAHILPVWITSSEQRIAMSKISADPDRDESLARTNSLFG